MSPKHWLLTLPLLRVAPLLTRLVLLRKHSIPTRRIIRRPPRRRSLSSRKDARRSFVSRPLSARHAGCPTQNVSRSQSNSIMVGTLTSYLRDIVLPTIHSTRYAAPTRRIGNKNTQDLAANTAGHSSGFRHNSRNNQAI